MNRLGFFLFVSCALPLCAREIPGEMQLPPELSAYSLTLAPETKELLLKKGDLLAICGDSITEQKQYSVLIETYLTACLPELEIRCRQFGWSGEQAGGFLGRIKSDVLRFKPDVATTCYGMNDFKYVPFEEPIAAEYRKNQIAVLEAFKSIGCEVVLGSPGIIDSVPHWVRSAKGTQQELNLSLSKFRNIDIEIAKEKRTSFADVYGPMLVADFEAKKKFGDEFKTAGNDGVHPDWAGHVIMAYAFLKGLGVDGDLGTITYDESSGKASATGGHTVSSSSAGTIELHSSRIAFCPGAGPIDQFNSMQTGLELVPFDDELNRFTLKISDPKAKNYKVTWGDQSKTFTGAEMKRGINLPKQFDANPMVDAFKKVEEAVSKKQAYETRQIKELAHGPEGAADIEVTFSLTEKTRAPLAAAVAESLQPVDHVITIAAESE